MGVGDNVGVTAGVTEGDGIGVGLGLAVGNGCTTVGGSEESPLSWPFPPPESGPDPGETGVVGEVGSCLVKLNPSK